MTANADPSRDMCVYAEGPGRLCAAPRSSLLHSPGYAGPYHEFVQAREDQIVRFENRVIIGGRVVDERDVVVRLRERAKVYICACKVHVQYGEVCIKCALLDAAFEIERLRTVDEVALNGG